MGRAHLDLRLRFAVTGVAGTMLLAAALVVGLNSFLTRAVLHREATATQAFLQSIVGYDSDGLRTDTGGGLMSDSIAHIRTHSGRCCARTSTAPTGASCGPPIRT